MLHLFPDSAPIIAFLKMNSVKIYRLDTQTENLPTIIGLSSVFSAKILVFVPRKTSKYERNTVVFKIIHVSNFFPNFNNLLCMGK